MPVAPWPTLLTSAAAAVRTAMASPWTAPATPLWRAVPPPPTSPPPAPPPRATAAAHAASWPNPPATPPPQPASEDVDKATGGLSVGDPDGNNLTVTLQVSHGTLTLGSTAGLSVSGNGSGAVTLAGNLADLNAALAGLVYRGILNYGGPDT